MVLKRLNDSIYFGNAVYSVKNSVFMTISLQLNPDYAIDFERNG